MLGDYMRRCHTMLAHISTTRSEMERNGLKSWGSAWQFVEPHLDRTICDFPGGLAKHHKDICLKWVDAWANGSHPGNDVLASVAAMLRCPQR